MIRNILMDLDETILDFTKCENVAITETFKKIGIEPTSENVKRYSAINDLHWKRLERKEITRQEVLIGRFNMLFNELGVSYSGEKANEIYKKCLGNQSFFIDGALETVKELYKKYNLYIVSNGTAVVQDSRIEKAKLATYFKKIFISEKLGVNKPDARFFELCFKEMPGIKKEETVIVGDSLTSDMLGGENAGIRNIWYNPKGIKNNLGVRIWREIRSLDEIKNIIEE